LHQLRDWEFTEGCGEGEVFVGVHFERVKRTVSVFKLLLFQLHLLLSRVHSLSSGWGTTAATSRSLGSLHNLCEFKHVLHDDFEDLPDLLREILSNFLFNVEIDVLEEEHKCGLERVAEVSNLHILDDIFNVEDGLRSGFAGRIFALGSEGNQLDVVDGVGDFWGHVDLRHEFAVGHELPILLLHLCHVDRQFFHVVLHEQEVAVLAGH